MQTIFGVSQKSFYIYESLDKHLQNNLEWWDRINHVACSILVVVGATVGIVGAVYMNDIHMQVARGNYCGSETDQIVRPASRAGGPPLGTTQPPERRADDGCVLRRSKERVLLVMEYCQHNFPDAVRSENYTESHFWRWSTSIARTMDWMHSRNVIHHDLKPQNIFISNDVKICDFGFARFCNVGTCSEMSVLGTWAYMPPEVMKMSINTNRKTQYDGRKFDIYSFSMILYFMWSRREPFWDISYARLPLEIALGNARPCISCVLAAAEEGA